MKKVLLSLMFIGVIGSLSYSLTRAYFSDKETVKGSRFTAGTLDLQVGSQGSSTVTPIEISGIGDGNDSGSTVYTIKNSGSLPGQLSLSLENIVNSENGCNDPEAAVDLTCDNPGDSQGELGKSIVASYYLDGTLLSQTTMDIASTDLLASVSPAVVLTPGQQAEFKIDWQAADYGNEVQSDSLSLDLNFSLKQLTK